MVKIPNPLSRGCSVVVVFFSCVQGYHQLRGLSYNKLIILIIIKLPMVIRCR